MALCQIEAVGMSSLGDDDHRRLTS